MGQTTERVNAMLGHFTLKLKLHCHELYSPFTPAPAPLPYHLPPLPLATGLAGPDLRFPGVPQVCCHQCHGCGQASHWTRA